MQQPGKKPEQPAKKNHRVIFFLLAHRRERGIRAAIMAAVLKAVAFRFFPVCLSTVSELDRWFSKDKDEGRTAAKFFNRQAL